MKLRSVVITTSGRHYESAWTPCSEEEFRAVKDKLGLLLERNGEAPLTFDAEDGRRMIFNPEHVVAVYVEGKS